jgi:DNA primase
LRIFKSGAFGCAVDQSAAHYRIIYQLLKDPNAQVIEYIDPEPRLNVERIYPEDTLAKLIPDYTYWVGRKIKEDVLRKLECGLASKEEKGKLSGRTVFPIRNLDGLIMGFTGRLVEDNSFAAKWKHLVRSSKTVYPWNVNGEAIRKSHTVVLVESVGDLLALMSHGIDNVICIFGLNLNSLIVSTLIGHDVKRVIISLNRDEDPRKGQAAARKIEGRLENFFTDIRVVFPPEPFKDWGDAAKKDDDAAFDVLRRELVCR